MASDKYEDVNFVSLPKAPERKEFVPGFIEVKMDNGDIAMIGIGHIISFTPSGNKCQFNLTENVSWVTVQESYQEIKRRLVWCMLREAGDDVGGVL